MCIRDGAQRHAIRGTPAEHNKRRRDLHDEGTRLPDETECGNDHALLRAVLREEAAREAEAVCETIPEQPEAGDFKVIP